MKTIIIALTSIFFISFQTYASEPDFFVNFLTCKLAIGSFVTPNESLKVVDGDPSFMGCSRKSNSVSCFYKFEAEKKINTVNYNITLDAPPLLHFSTSNGSEYIAIDTSQHSAVIITRALNVKYAGAKVCKGVYATAFEVKGIESLKKNKH